MMMTSQEQATVLIEFLDHLERLKKAHVSICADHAIGKNDFTAVLAILTEITSQRQSTECTIAMNALSDFKNASNELFMITMMSIMSVEVERLLGDLNPETKTKGE